jgi:hypothetical protein
MNGMTFGFKNIFLIDMTVFCHVISCSLVNMHPTAVADPTKLQEFG